MGDVKLTVVIVLTASESGGLEGVAIYIRFSR